MRKLWRIAVAVVAVLVVAAAAAILLTQYREIPPEDAPPQLSTIDIEQGALLAAAGNCTGCHTRDGGPELAGGRPLPTPFGTVYSTNITPDPETGIGRWSVQAFARAMWLGVDREGNHLYPVFPYDHFRNVAFDDLTLLHAFLLSREPVAYVPPANELDFPFNLRFLLAGWNLLYLEEGRYEPDRDRDAEWNRGAYLVQGLGHCGACHAPRDWLGAAVADAGFAGGEAEGWLAPALGAGSPAPVPWEVDPMVNYLIDGWDRDHGIAAGPMTSVVDSLSQLPEDDVYAIAAYIVSLQPEPDPAARDAALAFAAEREYGVDGPPPSVAVTVGDDPALRRGADTFGRICANCHRSDAQAAPLALTTTVNAPDPRNLVRIILDGITPPQLSPQRTMRAFDSLTDEELVDLVTFLRAHFSRQPEWPPAAITEAVAAARVPSPAR